MVFCFVGALFGFGQDFMHLHDLQVEAFHVVRNFGVNRNSVEEREPEGQVRFLCHPSHENLCTKTTRTHHPTQHVENNGGNKPLCFIFVLYRVFPWSTIIPN